MERARERKRVSIIFHSPRPTRRASYEKCSSSPHGIVSALRFCISTRTRAVMMLLTCRIVTHLLCRGEAKEIAGRIFFFPRAISSVLTALISRAIHHAALESGPATDFSAKQTDFRHLLNLRRLSSQVPRRERVNIYYVETFSRREEEGRSRSDPAVR